MTSRLMESAAEASSVLSEELQNDLADLVEAVVATHSGDPEALLGTAEWAEIDRRLARPLTPADPEAVAAFFSKYGV